MREITIKINENDALAMITELEAKGCYKTAKLIEDANSKAVVKDVTETVKKDFRQSWQKGYYFKHSDGRVEALYFNLRNREFCTYPIYISGMLMGRPTTLGHLKCLRDGLAQKGFKEVA